MSIYKEEAERLITKHRIFLQYDSLVNGKFLNPFESNPQVEKDAIRLSIICVDEIILSVQKNLPDAKSLINYYKLVKTHLRNILKSYLYYNPKAKKQIIA